MICYTDGACSSNGSPNAKGAYAAIVLDDNEQLIQIYTHNENNTTNNRQEMKAIIWCLLHYGKTKNLKIYSDSAYAINCFNSWMYNWALNGWLKSDNKEPENLDLVQGYYNLTLEGYKAELIKVKGHDSNKWNILADMKAKQAII